MKNEKKAATTANKATDKPSNTKKKTSVAKINNIITSAVGKTKAQAGRDHNNDGTWVTYEEERE